MKTAGIKGKGTDEAALQKDLRDLAYHYLTAILLTPLNLRHGPDPVKLFSRVQYLERHLIKPAQLLLEALSSENASLLSEWPEDLAAPLPDKGRLITELSALERRMTELHAALSDRLPEEDLTHEFMTDLANGLTDVLMNHMPKLKPTRGTYIRLTIHGPGKMYAAYLDIMRICLMEILPDDRTFSDQVIGQIVKLNR